jgi:hypothetical protein
VGISIGTPLIIEEKIPFDGSMSVMIGGKKRVTLSHDVSENILVSTK